MNTARAAAFSEAAYAPNNAIFASSPEKAKQQISAKLKEMDSKYPGLGLKNYEVVKATGDYYAIKNPQTKEMSIVFRGTNPGNIKDVGNDIQIATGFGPNRAKAGEQFAREVIKENPGYKVTVTGHSLGGTIAEKVATNLKDLGVKGVSFNAGSSPLNNPQQQSNIKSFHVEGDTISRFGVAGEKITLPRATHVPLGNHGLENFMAAYQNGQLPSHR